MLNVKSWSERGVFVILTPKCALHHTRMHFLNNATSKSAPNLMCFWRLDFKMCFAPQPGAPFQKLRCQKWPGREMLLTFWLRHVLRATAACNLRYLIRPDGSAPAALASLLFDPKKHCFASFLPFRPLILFLPLSRLTFSSLTPLATAASPVHTSEVWLLNFLRLLIVLCLARQTTCHLTLCFFMRFVLRRNTWWHGPYDTSPCSKTKRQGRKHRLQTEGQRLHRFFKCHICPMVRTWVNFHKFPMLPHGHQSINRNLWPHCRESPMMVGWP